MSYWPGDTFPASFQTLTYNASTNVLGITPFGNTVTLDPTNLDVSGALIVNTSTNSLFEVVGSNGLTTISQAPAGAAVSHYDNIKNVNNSTIMTAAQGIPANNGGYLINYTTYDLAGNGTVKGDIRILSTLASGSTGGVQLEGADGTYFNVGDGKTVTYKADGSVALATQTGVSTISQDFYVGGQYQCGIDYLAGPGNFSSIQMVSGANQLMGVSGNGVTFVPGANLPVLLSNGYFNVNNLALSNVSSINGNQVATVGKVVNYIDPYGFNPTYSTIGGSTAQVPMLVPFSTIAGHTYNVSVEFYAANNGGGNAGDTCSVAINNLNGGSPYGNITYLDTWAVSQSYNSYRVARSMLYTALSNNPDNASQLFLTNGEANGNSQLLTLALLSVQELGVPVANY